MGLKELREKRAEAFARTKALTEAADFDKAAFDAAYNEVEALDQRIDANKKVAEKEALEGSVDDGAKRDADRRNISHDEARHEREQWLDAYGSWMRSESPRVRSGLTEDQRRILQAVDDDVVATSVDDQGGLAVTADGVAGDMFYEVMRYKAPVLRYFTVRRRSTGAKAHAPGIDDSTNYGVLLTEGEGDREEDGVDFVKATFAFDHFDSAFIPVTYEALQDLEIRDLAMEMMDVASGRISRMMGYVFTAGAKGAVIPRVKAGMTSARPLETTGIVGSAAAGVVTAANSGIAADDVIRIRRALDPAYANANARLMLHNSTITEMELMKDNDNRYLFAHRELPSAGMGPRGDQMPAEGLINNVPYVVNNEVDEIAAGKTVAVYGDLSQYQVMMARTIVSESFHDSQTAAKRQVWFCSHARAAGVLRDAQAAKTLRIKA